jgi:hypothetical protein
VQRICFEWIAQSDALFYLGPSPGADSERTVARSLGLPIFSDDNHPPPNLPSDVKPEEVREIRLTEYSECADTYRHTYQTIWTAGSVLFAVSGGILGLLSHATATVDARVLAIALVPIWFWYLAVFRPMDRYGKMRRARLAAVEKGLNAAIPSLGMAHFSDSDILDTKSADRKWWQKLPCAFVCRPRVGWYVNLVGLLITAYEFYFGFPLLFKSSGCKWVNWVP